MELISNTTSIIVGDNITEFSILGILDKCKNICKEETCIEQIFLPVPIQQVLIWNIYHSVK